MNIFNWVGSYFDDRFQCSSSKERLFKRHAEDLEIAKIFERQRKFDEQPFTLNTARLSKEKGKNFSFRFIDQTGQAYSYRYDKEEELDGWLQQRNQETDIWEIEDESGEKPATTYKFRKLEGKGFETFQSKEALNYRVNAIYERHKGWAISDQLPTYAYCKARLREQEDCLIFEYTDAMGQKQTLHCQDETELNNKLSDEIDLWEIRTDQGELYYKLLNPEGTWVDHFTSAPELFQHITQESGRLWRMRISDPNGDRFMHMLACKGWGSKPYFESRKLEDLAYIIRPEPLPSQPASPVCEPFRWETAVKAGVFVTLFLGYSLVNVSKASRAARRGFSSLPIGLGLLARMIPTAASQQAPTLAVPSPLSLKVNPGQSVNLSLASYFSLPANQIVGFYATPPSFLTLNIGPQLVNTISAVGNVQAVTVVGNVLHAFGNGYQTINISATPTQVLDFYGNGTGVLDGVLNLNYAHLAVGTYGYQIVDAANPHNLTLVAQIAATNSVTAIALDAIRAIVWIGDVDLKSVNISIPTHPILLQTFSFLNQQFIAALSIYMNNEVFVLALPSIDIDGAGDVIGVNVTNPENLTLIEFANGGVSADTYNNKNGGIACANGFCFAGSVEYISICNVTSPVPNCNQDFGIDLSDINSIVWKQLVYIVGGAGIQFVDASRSNTPMDYLYLLVNASQANSVYPLNDLLYVCTSDGIFIYQLQANNTTISGTPTLSNRGNYTFDVTATNFAASTATLTVLLQVLDKGPMVANLLPPLTAIVNNYFFYLVPNNTFSDPDDPISSLVFTLNAGSLPLLFNNAMQVIEGTPTQLGNFNLSLTATDPYGKSAVAIIMLHVMQAQNSNNTVIIPVTDGLSSTGSSNTAGIVVGILLATGALVVVIGGVVYIVKRRRGKKEQTEFKLSPVVVNKIFASTFGGGKYATLKWNRQEVEACHKATALIPNEKTGGIGFGHYGEVSMCWDIHNSRYAVMKVVDIPQKFKESIDEAERQKLAAGKGVWPVHNYVQDNEQNRLVVLSPPAGLKDLTNVSRRISDASCEEKRQLFATYIAADILEGLKRLRKVNMSHLDLKGANVFVSKEGNAGIADFGSSVVTKKEYIPQVRSDIHYKSPEQLDKKKIYSDKEDCWATGLTILEFLLGKDPAVFINIDNYRQQKSKNASYTYEQHVNNQLAAISQLTSAQEGTIWDVARKLLITNPEQRWTAAKALEAKCFQDLDDSKREELFALLIPQLAPVPSANQLLPQTTPTVPVNPRMVILTRNDSDIAYTSSVFIPPDHSDKTEVSNPNAQTMFPGNGLRPPRYENVVDSTYYN